MAAVNPQSSTTLWLILLGRLKRGKKGGEYVRGGGKDREKRESKRLSGGISSVFR